MSSAGSITLSIDDAQHKIFPPWIASEHPDLQLITFLLFGPPGQVFVARVSWSASAPIISICFNPRLANDHRLSHEYLLILGSTEKSGSAVNLIHALPNWAQYSIYWFGPRPFRNVSMLSHALETNYGGRPFPALHPTRTSRLGQMPLLAHQLYRRWRGQAIRRRRGSLKRLAPRRLSFFCGHFLEHAKMLCFLWWTCVL